MAQRELLWCYLMIAPYAEPPNLVHCYLLIKILIIRCVVHVTDIKKCLPLEDIKTSVKEEIISRTFMYESNVVAINDKHLHNMYGEYIFLFT